MPSHYLILYCPLPPPALSLPRIGETFPVRLQRNTACEEMRPTRGKMQLLEVSRVELAERWKHDLDAYDAQRLDFSPWRWGIA